MSYLNKKNYEFSNSYLKNTILSYNVNTDKVGIYNEKIDNFLLDILKNDEDSIELELLKREDQLVAYRKLEQRYFIKELVDNLKKEKLLETHHADRDILTSLKSKLNDKREETARLYGDIDGLKNENSRLYNNIDELKLNQKKKIGRPLGSKNWARTDKLLDPNYSFQSRYEKLQKIDPNKFAEIIEGDGIFDYIKSKFRKGVSNIKSLGKLLFMKYWKDLAIILFRLARGENIKQDDLLFVRRMVNDGLLNPANENFRKLTNFFGDKLINKLKQLITIRNTNGGMIMLKYPSKQNMIKYPSKSLIF